MSTFMEQARDSLAEDLRYGKSVDGLTLRHLIESDLAGPRCGFAALEVSGLLVAEEPDRSLYIGRYLDGLIAAYLDSKEVTVAELAAAMREDYMESQRSTA